jgi:hypothetical protein
MSVQNKLTTQSLPPKIPQNNDLLSRAITLLGNRTQAQLKPKAKLELEQLIGCYPDQQEASLWKKELTRIKKERTSTP